MEFKDYSTKQSRMAKSKSFPVGISIVFIVIIISLMILGVFGPIIG